MTTDDQVCPCAWCGVHVRDDNVRPELNADSYPCGHRRCFCCRLSHPSECWVCEPQEPWRTKDALAWAVRHYQRDAERAAVDFAGQVRWIVSTSGGGGGPHSPSYETRGHKLSIWPPNSDKRFQKAPFSFTVETALREAIKELQRSSAATLGAEYVGAPLQGVLL